jgi:hypothetical protein
MPHGSIWSNVREFVKRLIGVVLVKGVHDNWSANNQRQKHRSNDELFLDGRVLLEESRQFFLQPRLLQALD